MPRSDLVSLVADGQRLSTWSSYTIDSRLLTPADGWRLTCHPATSDERAALRHWLRPGKRVRLYVGGGDVSTGATIEQERYLQLTGIVDQRETQGTRDGGTEFQVEGRDVGALLVDASVPINLVREAGARFTDLARAAVQPWGIEVVADWSAERDILAGRARRASSDRLHRDQAREHGIASDRYSRRVRVLAELLGRPIDEVAVAAVEAQSRTGSANGMVQPDIERLTMREARPRAGETVWQFLQRHAERLGLLLWMTPTGRLVLSSPRYDQEPLYRLVRRERNDTNDPNTILAGGETLNGGERYSRVTVYGRARGDDLTRSSIVATEIDTEFEADVYRPAVLHDNSVRTVDEAQRRAKKELAKSKANAQILRYTVAHHGQGDYLFAIDRVANVVDEIAGVEGNYYIVARTFKKTREQGTTADLELVPRGSIPL